MEITTRTLWTLIHGMGFGVLYLLACSGALVELWRMTRPAAGSNEGESNRWLGIYLLSMTALAWAAVLTGTYVIYPWYRAVPPAGAALAEFPQALLRSNTTTAGWHTLGMEWKEHVAWLTPISITMAAAVFLRYGRQLQLHTQLRRAVLIFTCASFVSAGIAGFWGAMINKVAPTQGGQTIHLMQGKK
jgi:hypothetical protein